MAERQPDSGHVEKKQTETDPSNSTEKGDNSSKSMLSLLLLLF